MLTLNPSRYLPFEGPQNQDMISSVKLTNQTTTNVAFKIKTNVPKCKFDLFLTGVRFLGWVQNHLL
jgi:hypothetical protein